MARRKSNPEHAGSILLLAGVAVAGYLAYVNGWLSNLLPAAAPTPTPTPTTGTTNPVTNPNTQIVNAPSAPPPLGTVVTTANDISAQALAGYAYILPGPGINTSVPPSGYTAFTTTDYGTIYLRNNVYQVASTDMNNRIQRAINAGAAASSVQNAGNMTLAQIQQDMSNNGLTGMGMTKHTDGWGRR